MAIFDDDPWCHRVQHDFLYKMVSLVHDESARIVSTFFHAKATNFASRSEPNRGLFWGNDLEFIIAAKNSFWWYITYLCLKLLQKVTFFDINCQKCQYNFASFYVKGQLGLRIRIQDHLWTLFDVTVSMAISYLTKELPLKIILARFSRFTWNFNNLISILYFGNQAYPWTHVPE